MLDDRDTIKMISIDPGLNNIGIANIIYNKIKRNIDSVEAFTIVPNDYIRNNTLSNYIDERSLKQQILIEKYIEVLHTYQPELVICENAFFYNNKPVAFQALIESITLMKHTTINYDPTITFILLSPLEIKHSLKVKNISDKDSTKQALVSYGINTLTDLDTMVEHSIDAIAVGYSFLKTRELI